MSGREFLDIRTEAEVVRFPGRHMDEKGKGNVRKVIALLSKSNKACGVNKSNRSVLPVKRCVA
jgi:hypothetical protein